MYMETLDVNSLQNNDHILDETLRQQALDYSKDFKTSWINLGQTLYSIWRDKTFYTWGYEKFEHYTEKEVGLKKQVAMKLLKTYIFLEEEEPIYLKKEYAETRDASKIPSYEAVNILRLAKGKKELLKEDYQKLRNVIFEKGKDVSAVRKDLASIMKERKHVDPEQEREDRNLIAIRKVYNSLRSFKKDMEALKLVPDEILTTASELIDKLETQIP